MMFTWWSFDGWGWLMTTIKIHQVHHQVIGIWYDCWWWWFDEGLRMMIYDGYWRLRMMVNNLRLLKSWSAFAGYQWFLHGQDEPRITKAGCYLPIWQSWGYITGCRKKYQEQDCYLPWSIVVASSMFRHFSCTCRLIICWQLQRLA